MSETPEVLGFELELGDEVYVTPKGRDPGGIGVVTAREWREDARGVRKRYRIKLHKAFFVSDGYWYDIERLE